MKIGHLYTLARIHTFPLFVVTESLCYSLLACPQHQVGIDNLLRLLGVEVLERQLLTEMDRIADRHDSKPVI